MNITTIISNKNFHNISEIKEYFALKGWEVTNILYVEQFKDDISIMEEYKMSITKRDDEMKVVSE